MLNIISKAECAVNVKNNVKTTRKQCEINVMSKNVENVKSSAHENDALLVIVQQIRYSNERNNVKNNVKAKLKKFSVNVKNNVKTTGSNVKKNIM